MEYYDRVFPIPSHYTPTIIFPDAGANKFRHINLANVTSLVNNPANINTGEAGKYRLLNL